MAHLLFAEGQAIDFARIVSELDGVLTRLRGPDVRILWDCDDLVIFDMSDTRILLAWADGGVLRRSGCLTVSVGPGPTETTEPGLPRPGRTEHEVLCSRLVERILMRLEPCAVLWCQVAGPVDAQIVDELAEAVPDIAADLAPDLPPVDSILDNLTQTYLHLATQTPEARRSRAMSPMTPAPALRPAFTPMLRPALTPAPRPAPRPAQRPTSPPTTLRAAKDRPHPPRSHSTELANVRLALYPAQPRDARQVHSTPMRLAAHCLNATLIVVWAPLGAAVMTYALLRGENMQMSARLMAVAGTFFALAHSRVGDTMVAMARSLG